MKPASAALLCALVACDVDEPESPVVSAPQLTLGARDLTTASATPSASTLPHPDEAAPCTAPSMVHGGPLDARESDALKSCQRPSTGPGRAGRRCGQEADLSPIDHRRLERAVRRIDDATASHLQAIAAKGVTLGRKPRAFGLVGDSMTVSGAFLRSAPTVVDPQLSASLGGIIGWYADVEVTRVRGVWRDSFGAPRAAKVGKRAAWALDGGAGSPLRLMVRQVSPAVAVVLFGGNDAAFTGHMSLDELSDTFARDLEAIVDALEDLGVIPVLNTLARHGSAPGFEDCAAGRELTNWRMTVQTNALSARVVEIACRRKLPLIDVRDALDTAVNLGLGPDQIHPSAYEKGPEILDQRGMRCGYNVRNYVTLLMLQRIRELVFVDDAAGNRSTKQ